MVKLNEQFVTDKAGRSAGVMLRQRDYRRLMDYVEDLEDRLEIKRRKKSAQFVSWDQVKAGLNGASA